MPDSPAADVGAAEDTAATTTTVKVGAAVTDATGASLGTVSKITPAAGGKPATVEITSGGKTKSVAATSLSASGSGLLWTDDTAGEEPK